MSFLAKAAARFSRKAKHSNWVCSSRSETPEAGGAMHWQHSRSRLRSKCARNIMWQGRTNPWLIAGNRWHLNCFRCNTCGTLLDSDANLLLLGDGSLICNNCTYSCSACGDKIEDLAILTGDQAFCATCFRCRNCKRKIENLRYARTSQGIFCMSCHESLMARRRKKSKAAAQAKAARDKESSPMVQEKSLPALPPNAIPPNAFSDDRVDPESDMPTTLSPRPKPSYQTTEPSSRGSSRPPRSPDRPSMDAGLNIPPASYRKNRNSSIFTGSDTQSAHNHNVNADDGSFFIPVALDPSPAPSVTPRSTTDAFPKSKEKDYFSMSKSNGGTDRKGESQSSTPHIAFQEKPRRPSSEYEASPVKEEPRKAPKQTRSESQPSVSTTGQAQNNGGSTDNFKLQDAPKSKKTATSRSESSPNVLQDAAGNKAAALADRKDRDNQGLADSPHIGAQLADRQTAPRSSHDSRPRDEAENRSTTTSSTAANGSQRPIARKEIATTNSSRNVNGTAAKQTKSEDTTSPPRNQVNQYMTPRAPPAPPNQAGDATEPKTSPKLPRWSSGGDFSMDEDMARILGTDEGSSSILRRVSNAVRHGRTSSTESAMQQPPRVSAHTRSISETTRTTMSPRWPKSPLLDESLLERPTSPAPLGLTDDPNFLRRQLRTSEQRVLELESQFTNDKDLQSLSQKLEEKRKTVSVLDTQTEIMIRQLEVLAGFVEKAKETKRPIDPRELEESALRDFVAKLEKLKQSMTASLQQLHAERDQVLEEKIRAVADRDRARQEFEQLASKNAQLADLNNDLTHQIQERFRNNSDGRSPGPNGLGIYHQHKGTSNASISLDNASIHTGTTMVAADNDEPILESGPTVIKIGKGQVKKFNWKKGSKAVAQNIAKGMNRTAAAFQQPERGHGMAGDNLGMPYNMTVVPVESPVVPASNQAPPIPNRHQQGDGGRQGFFGFKKSATMPRTVMGGPNMSTHDLAEPPTVLFGSELADRADYERRQIPCVVTRCIEEVELRGMDMEGIYRKTGGNSQVKIIQEGFDKNENFDISDPDLDITAVTSVLKQYFRKLPNPLLTYDIYDQVLEIGNLPNDTEKCAHLQRVFNELPRQHKDCLEFLMFHLSRVASREKENLMTPKNLAVVFAPTIMRATAVEREMTDMHAKNLAVQFIIDNSAYIFS
ncbi:uncharacterized protein B0I36DRAFT_118565 [Microdochium trichocladiopsis]|uniref:Uncharacterized protein n=1 Tax=Microdochium trichocladiopsis TaxID=1682393 RepID=A0A9P8Y6K9_9PEZI|nr:uncharacterized protein B0I36DRAFT_118565 [Microdochium trichocladiopsis]KAH7031105.1 hypothetical protein B0I36DRAFT_118565 [Microdochium trichocladiopsis]